MRIVSFKGTLGIHVIYMPIPREARMSEYRFTALQLEVSGAVGNNTKFFDFGMKIFCGTEF